MRIVNYLGGSSGRGLSGFWGQLPIEDILAGPGNGFFFHDDFLTWRVDANTATQYEGQAGPYTGYVDTGGSITQLLTEPGGVIRGTVDATGTEEEISFSPGATASTVFGKVTKGSENRLLFEARIRLGQITAQSVFVGMAEEGLVANDGTFADSSPTAMSDKDYIGFRILEADPDGIDAVHSWEGRTTAEAVIKNEAQVAVASTWYKLGFAYDGRDLHYYVDGVKVGTVLKSAMLATAAGKFPTGEYLVPLINLKVAAAAARTIDVDWIACGGTLL